MQEDANTEPSPLGDAQGYQPRQLVLLGAGQAHLHLLAQIPRQRLVGARITLVAPHAHYRLPSHLAAWVAGERSLEQCSIDLEPLVRRSGIRWLTRSVRGLDMDSRTVLLDDLSTLQFDWLSINTGSVQNRAVLDQTLPGVREHGLFLRPMESFCALWPQLVAMAETRALRVAVIGAGLAGCEMALAMRQRLPHCAVTLVGEQAPGHGQTAAFGQRLQQRLRAMGINVLRSRVVGVQAGEIRLDNGARLACDVPVVATGAQAPYWLQPSGLALDAQGFVQVEPSLRSCSHDFVFAAGDVRGRLPGQVADLAQARRDAHTLVRNLAAMVAGQALRDQVRPGRAGPWLEMQAGQALVAGPALLDGKLAGWLKRRRDARQWARWHAH